MLVIIVMIMQESNDHHVAWADRIGINKQWSRDIEACSESYGTSTFHHMVRRFKNNIPNIKNGPQLQTMISEYQHHLFNDEYQDMLYRWAKENPQEADNESFVLQKEDEIRMYLNELLYRYIIQLLEDHGFGFYKSNQIVGSDKEIEYKD